MREEQVSTGSVWFLYEIIRVVGKTVYIQQVKPCCGDAPSVTSSRQGQLAMASAKGKGTELSTLGSESSH